MKYFWLPLVCILCWVALPASYLQEESQLIAEALAEYIDNDLPVFLAVHCGEYSPYISEKLQQILLQKSVDIRQQHTAAFLQVEPGAQTLELLQEYELSAAKLVQIDMNLQWENIEHKSFLSYRNERRPLYSFIQKQVRLPEHQVIQIDSYNFRPAAPRDKSISAPRLRWFEPLIASTALASIIFLLWTIE